MPRPRATVSTLPVHPPPSAILNASYDAPPSDETKPAEAPKPGVLTEEITASEIERRRKQAEESADLTDDIKSKVAEHYRLAAELLLQAEQQAGLLVTLKSYAESIPSRVEQLRRELESLQNSQVAAAPSGALSSLEQELAAADLRLKELKEVQAKLEAEPAARATRRKELRALVAGFPNRREELRKQLEAAPPADEPPLQSLARRTEALARLGLLRQQGPVLQAELSKYDAEESADLLRLERDIVARRITRSTEEWELINASVRRQREVAARAAVRQAEEEVINAHPVLKTLAEENHRLAEEAQSLAAKQSDAETKMKSARVRLEEIEKQWTQTKTKVDAVGLTGAIGMLLRKQRTELPHVGQRRQNVACRRAEIDAAQLAFYEYDHQRTELSTPEPVVAGIVRLEGLTVDDAERQRLKTATENLLQRRCQYLDTLIRNYGSYFDGLVELGHDGAATPSGHPGVSTLHR